MRQYMEIRFKFKNREMKKMQPKCNLWFQAVATLFISAIERNNKIIEWA